MEDQNTQNQNTAALLRFHKTGVDLHVNTVIDVGPDPGEGARFSIPLEPNTAMAVMAQLLSFAGRTLERRRPLQTPTERMRASLEALIAWVRRMCSFEASSAAVLNHFFAPSYEVPTEKELSYFLTALTGAWKTSSVPEEAIGSALAIELHHHLSHTMGWSDDQILGYLEGSMANLAKGGAKHPGCKSSDVVASAIEKGPNIFAYDATQKTAAGDFADTQAFEVVRSGLLRRIDTLARLTTEGRSKEELRAAKAIPRGALEASFSEEFEPLLGFRLSEVRKALDAGIFGPDLLVRTKDLLRQIECVLGQVYDFPLRMALSLLDEVSYEMHQRVEV